LLGEISHALGGTHESATVKGRNPSKQLGPLRERQRRLAGRVGRKAGKCGLYAVGSFGARGEDFHGISPEKEYTLFVYSVNRHFV
jgi:hypothetical protein